MSVRNLTITAGSIAAISTLLFLILGIYSLHGIEGYTELADSVSNLSCRLERISILLDNPSAKKEIPDEIKGTDELFNFLLKGVSADRVTRGKDPILSSRLSGNIVRWQEIRTDLKTVIAGETINNKDPLKKSILILSGSVLSLSPLIKDDSLVLISRYRKAIVIFSAFLLVLIRFSAVFVIRRILLPLEEVTKEMSGGPEDSGKGASAAKKEGLARFGELGCLLGRYNKLSRSLEESLAHYRDLVNTIPDAVVEIDKDGKIIFINEAASVLTGYARKDAVDRTYTDFIPHEATPHVEEVFKAVMKGETVKGHEFPMRLKDGRIRFFEFSSAPIWKRAANTEGGTVIGCRSVGRDIDERKKIMDELKNARKEAEETSGKLKKTVEDLEDFALLAVRRELKMHEIRERFQKLKEERR